MAALKRLISRFGLLRGGSTSVFIRVCILRMRQGRVSVRHPPSRAARDNLFRYLIASRALGDQHSPEVIHICARWSGGKYVTDPIKGAPRIVVGQVFLRVDVVFAQLLHGCAIGECPRIILAAIYAVGVRAESVDISVAVDLSG